MRRLVPGHMQDRARRARWFAEAMPYDLSEKERRTIARELADAEMAAERKGWRFAFHYRQDGTHVVMRSPRGIFLAEDAQLIRPSEMPKEVHQRLVAAELALDVLEEGYIQ